MVGISLILGAAEAEIVPESPEVQKALRSPDDAAGPERVENSRRNSRTSVPLIVLFSFFGEV